MEGLEAKRCRLVGKVDDITWGFKILLNEIIKFESKINGKRKNVGGYK